MVAVYKMEPARTISMGKRNQTQGWIPNLTWSAVELQSIKQPDN